MGIVCAASTAFDLGADVSRLTHGHPTGFLAGGFLASLIANLVEGLPLRDAVVATLAILAATSSEPPWVSTRSRHGGSMHSN